MLLKRLVLLCGLWTARSSGHTADAASPFDTIPRDTQEALKLALSEGLQSLLGLDTLLEPDHNRRLQTRTCNEEIGRATKAEILGVATFLVEALFGDNGLSPNPNFKVAANAVLGQLIEYDIVSYKVCSSCEEAYVLRQGEAFLADEEPYGFASYCGPGNFWHNATSSGVLLIPADPDTGDFLVGKHKGFLHYRGTTSSERTVYSELWPEPFLEIFGPSQNVTIQAATLLSRNYNLLAPMAASAAGVMSVMVDNIGYGEGVEEIKSYVVRDYYGASGIPLIFKAQDMVASMGEGCTTLGEQFTVGGYSEGGYSAAVGALTVDKLPDFTVLSANLGAGPYQLFRVSWFAKIRQMIDGTLPTVQNLFLALITHAYSSTNPDLANTGQGQDALSEEWMNASNPEQNIILWVDDSFAESAAQLGPLPENLTEIINPVLVELTEDAIAAGTDDGCSLTTAARNALDKLCEAGYDNEVADDLLAVAFPTVFCHSPQDEVVSYDNVPDVTQSDFLSLFTLFPVQGGHAEASIPCLFGQMIPFTGPAATAIEPDCVPTSEPSDAPSPMPSKSPSGAPSPMPSKSPAPSSKAPTKALGVTEEPSSSAAKHLASLVALAVSSGFLLGLLA